MRRAALWPLTGLAVLVGLVVVLAIAGWLYVHSRFDTPGPVRDERTVVLAPGLGAFDIADQLEAAGVIDDPLLFVAGLWIEDKQHALKAGEYVFEALVTPRGVMEKLVAGDTVAHPVHRHGGNDERRSRGGAQCCTGAQRRALDGA